MAKRQAKDLGLTGGRGPAAAPELPAVGNGGGGDTTGGAGIWVRTTVALPFAGARGSVHYVDPTDPDVLKALKATWLVPLPGENWPPEEAS